MSKYLMPSMFAAWLIGLLFGFYYGLNNMRLSLILYLYLIIIVLIVVIGTKFAKRGLHA